MSDKQKVEKQDKTEITKNPLRWVAGGLIFVILVNFGFKIICEITETIDDQEFEIPLASSSAKQ